MAQKAPGEVAAGCSGASKADYACYQDRYQNLVRYSGVETAFEELKEEHAKNDFVKRNCHQMVHVIGRAAADLHGDIPTVYGQGDDFCGAGYYHGAMEAIVAKVGADRILAEAGTLCADLSEQQRYSYHHRNCVHGLGHGFMGAREGELFESLEVCDSLAERWEREHCYGGVFMENVMSEHDPGSSPKYLKAGQPLYPCTDVEDRYKDQCYKRQTLYALGRQSGDFAKVFGLCKEVEDGFRPACYQGVGWDIGGFSVNGEGVAETDKNELARRLCALGGDYEARSSCAVGAVKLFANYYPDDTDQAEALCESFDRDVRPVCREAGEKYYGTFEP